MRTSAFPPRDHSRAEVMKVALGSTAATNLRAEGLRRMSIHLAKSDRKQRDSGFRGRRQARPRASDFLASPRSGALCYDELQRAASARGEPMMRFRGKAIACSRAAVWAALALTLISASAVAQKSGGILKIPHGDSPASMSIHEESTIVSEGPMMAVFNDLVMFDQHIPQNRLDTIVPDLAVEWPWSEDGTTLTFKLRQGVKWHDGKPFTARDVNCTGICCWPGGRKSSGSIRANPGIRTSPR